MSNSSLAERPTRTLADLDSFVDRRADEMSKKEMKAFEREAQKIMKASNNRSDVSSAQRGKDR
jgi:hypothetical protein